jgi:hypothetical protein
MRIGRRLFGSRSGSPVPPPGEIKFPLFTIQGVNNCEVSGERLPLVAISHGSRGRFDGNLACAMVRVLNRSSLGPRGSVWARSRGSDRRAARSRKPRLLFSRQRPEVAAASRRRIRSTRPLKTQPTRPRNLRVALAHRCSGAGALCGFGRTGPRGRCPDAQRVSASGPGCVKTQTFNLRVESPSRFRQSKDE